MKLSKAMKLVEKGKIVSVKDAFCGKIYIKKELNTIVYSTNLDFTCKKLFTGYLKGFTEVEIIEKNDG